MAELHHSRHLSSCKKWSKQSPTIQTILEALFTSVNTHFIKSEGTNNDQIVKKSYKYPKTDLNEGRK